AALMDKETWIGAEQAVADGFATGLLDSAQVSKDTNASGSRKALALIEASMARAGYSRGARRDALKALFDGTPGAAADNAMPGAGDDVAASLQNLINALQG
ncbi:Clp protease ClpP, partial [Paraburkholderia tropica]